MEYQWSAVRSHAIELFNGELPRPESEAVIIEAFEILPQVVVRAIGEVGEDVRAGRARSGWAVLRARIQGTEASRDVLVSGPDRRSQLVLNAERWIHNAGVFCETESMLVEALFGETAILRDFAGDEVLRRRMVEVWRAERPRGLRAEEEALERDAAFLAGRERTRRIRLEAARELELAQAGSHVSSAGSGAQG